MAAFNASTAASIEHGAVGIPLDASQGAVYVLQADAQTLGLLLLIQDILVAEGRDASHPCHVVSTVRRPQTIEACHSSISLHWLSSTSDNYYFSSCWLMLEKAAQGALHGIHELEPSSA